MKIKPLQHAWKSGIIAGICFWLTPFVIFLRYQDYPLASGEVLACVSLLGVLGVLSGLAMESVGQYSRAIVYAFLITLTSDIQMHQGERLNILIGILVVSAVVMFLIRRPLARFGHWILVAMLISSFASPVGPGMNTQKNPNAPPGNPDLPPFLHIILDEQIGVEGIPEEFDTGGKHASALRDFYIERGFGVFGRVYSQYPSTWGTIPKLFNFRNNGYKTGEQFHARDLTNYYLSSNAYFELMQERGYRISTYQTTFMRFCGGKTNFDVANCFTYDTEAINVIHDSRLPLKSKMGVIFGVYSRLSILSLRFDIPSVRLNPLSSTRVLELLKNDLVGAQPGELYIVHLMLPHYPYAFNSECQLRPGPASWLGNDDLSRERKAKAEREGRGREKQPFFDRNTPESRAERYPLYLDQVTCTHNLLAELFAAINESGRFDDMTILVHGDHGSRINIKIPNAKYSGYYILDSDYPDAYSTLFAYKGPGVPPVYDRRMLPLGPLFQAIIQDGHIPAGTEWAGKQQVYFRNGTAEQEAQNIPVYSRVLPGNE